MRRQADQLHEQEIPLAGLTASESIIYGRFGYGVASFAEHWSIQRHHTAYAAPFQPKGRLSFVPPDGVKDIFPEDRAPGACRPPRLGAEAGLRVGRHRGGSGVGQTGLQRLLPRRLRGRGPRRRLRDLLHQGRHPPGARANGGDGRRPRGVVALLLRRRPDDDHQGVLAPRGRPAGLDAGGPRAAEAGGPRAAVAEAGGRAQGAIGPRLLAGGLPGAAGGRLLLPVERGNLQVGGVQPTAPGAPAPTGPRTWRCRRRTWPRRTSAPPPSARWPTPAASKSAGQGR